MNTFQEVLRRRIHWHRATHNATEVFSRLGLLLTER
jgi:hypothetical protein